MTEYKCIQCEAYFESDNPQIIFDYKESKEVYLCSDCTRVQKVAICQYAYICKFCKNVFTTKDMLIDECICPDCERIQADIKIEESRDHYKYYCEYCNKWFVSNSPAELKGRYICQDCIDNLCSSNKDILTPKIKTKDNNMSPICHSHNHKTKENLPEEGTKHDDDKPKYADMIKDFEIPLRKIYKVYEYGVKKYGRNNWKKLLNLDNRADNAFMRHFFSEESEIHDPETGLPHLWHMTINLLFRLFDNKEKIRRKNNNENL